MPFSWICGGGDVGENGGGEEEVSDCRCDGCLKCEGSGCDACAACVGDGDAMDRLGSGIRSRFNDCRSIGAGAFFGWNGGIAMF
jgi:hypothetical protein